MMAFAESWKRSADAAAAIHQIRNRLQSIIIEAALLKRTAGGDPAGLARIGALAQDGASYLELFAELLPAPPLNGVADLSEAAELLEENGIRTDAAVLERSVRSRSDALVVLLQTVLLQAIPFRGFRAKRLSVGAESGDRAEFVIELEPGPGDGMGGGVTPWMSAQQMARDLGGSLELHSGGPPHVKLFLPLAQAAVQK